VKKIVFCLVFVALMSSFLVSSYFKPSTIKDKSDPHLKTNIYSIDDLNGRTNSKKTTLNTDGNNLKQNPPIANETSKEQKGSSLIEFALTKENVPAPFIAFDFNVRLTWQDYQVILEMFEKYGSPIKYDRESTENVSAGNWWIEHTGYNDAGESLFSIINLNSFTESSYKLTEDIYNYDLATLNGNDSLGEYNLDVENSARDALYASNSYAESIVCRSKKCLLKIRHSEDSDFDIVAFTEHVKSEMEKVNPDEECKVNWSPLKPAGNMIYVTCSPI